MAGMAWKWRNPGGIRSDGISGVHCREFRCMFFHMMWGWQIYGYSGSQIAGWLLLGLLAGAIARALMFRDMKGGLVATILLGIAGAFVGGWIGAYTGFLSNQNPTTWVPSPGSLLTATVGAIVILSLYRWIRK